MPKRHDKITKSVNYDYYWDILFCTVPLLAVSCFYYGARPLLMMDDTSWGSGIEQLGIFFVQYTMLEHFTNWEQAAARSLLADSELESYQF